MGVLKKYLPFILLGLGLLIVVIIYFVMNTPKKTSSVGTDDEKVAETPFEKRPVLSLTPTKDGHYLTLAVDKIDIKAKTMDYELLYDVPDGVTQGVPGTVDIEGKSSFQADLLLGSESSGRFRYDEGVSNGTVTLRFRDEKGKLVAKFKSDFLIFRDTNKLTSADGAFTMNLSSSLSDATVVVMPSVGTHSKAPSNEPVGPYGVYSSDTSKKLSGSVTIDGTSSVYLEDGSFTKISTNVSKESPLLFVGTK